MVLLRLAGLVSPGGYPVEKDNKDTQLHCTIQHPSISSQRKRNMFFKAILYKANIQKFKWDLAMPRT